MKYKNTVLYSDMDGTLLNSEGKVSAKNKEALRRFMEQGGLFGIATGRNQLNAIGFLEDIKVNIPCILYNGSGIYDFHQDKFIDFFELKKDKLVRFLRDCLGNHPNIMIQIFCPNMSYFVSPEELADERIVETHQPCQFGQIEEILDQPWIKILLCAEHGELNLLEKAIVEYELVQDIQWVYSSNVYLELLPAGVSKGSALESVRKYIGSHVKIYAVGDFYNDMEMVRLADVGIAMRNAVPELQEAADMVTVSNDENAIADIIDHIIALER
ncbi:MAG: HAD family hydrolase [Mobilitalea sp.]